MPRNLVRYSSSTPSASTIAESNLITRKTAMFSYKLHLKQLFVIFYSKQFIPQTETENCKKSLLNKIKLTPSNEIYSFMCFRHCTEHFCKSFVGWLLGSKYYGLIYVYGIAWKPDLHFIQLNRFMLATNINSKNTK